MENGTKDLLWNCPKTNKPQCDEYYLGFNSRKSRKVALLVSGSYGENYISLGYLTKRTDVSDDYYLERIIYEWRVDNHGGNWSNNVIGWFDIPTVLNYDN